MNVTFENPEYLYWLLSIPLLYGLLILWRRSRVRVGSLMFNHLNLAKVNVAHSENFNKRNILLLTGLSLSIIAYANPRLPGAKETVKQQASDIAIALDVSKSMLARDISPDRMTRAKRFLSDLVDRLKGERIAFIVFAGSSYVSMPLTEDYVAAKEFINGASTDMVSLQGTAIGDAIRLAVNTFPKDDVRSRGLIIVSDGEDHDSDALTAATEASKNGVVIYTVGVGSDRGAMIPEANEDGSKVKLDESGQPIRTVLNEKELISIASGAKGKYFNIAAEEQALNGLDKFVNSLSKGEFKLEETTSYRSLAMYLLVIALGLFFLELLLEQGYLNQRKTNPNDV